jgi:hypothetical protein
MDFVNAENVSVRVNISPTDILIPDIDTPQIIALKGSGNPVVISASNNDQDKFSVVRSKSAKIQFRTENGLNAATFSQGGDNLWRVDILVDVNYIFRGYLIMADIQQPFQPDPQYVTLTATDHLATLKELLLQDLSGANPTGKYRVADIINFCLQKTGLSLHFFVVNNLRAGGAQFAMSATFHNTTNTITVTDTKMFYAGQRVAITGTVSNNNTNYVKSVDSATQVTMTNALVAEGPVTATFTDYNSQFHWYDNVYLDAKTFESEVGKCENCYTVLEKILGEDCFITQYKGNWWIFRVDEMEDNPIYVAEFLADGTYSATTTGMPYGWTYDFNIGRGQSWQLANADTLLRFVRPNGKIKETLNFSLPLEVPCNVQFLRGTITSDTPTLKKYTISCWTKLYHDGTGDHTSTANIYIEAQFVNGYEVNRYVKFEADALHSFIKSEAIPVSKNDKFNIDVSRRQESNHAGSSQQTDVYVRLYGNDGTYWTHHGKTPADPNAYWVQCDSLFTTFQQPFIFLYDASFDKTQTISLYDGLGAQIPVSGDLYILVYPSALWGSSEATFVSKVTFEYIPYIAGTYSRYSGQYNEVDRIQSGYYANRDNQVYIGDLPVKLYKGAMFLNIQSGYWLFQNWFAAGSNGGTYTGLPSTDYLHPYGYIQAFSVWNQYKGYNKTSPTTRGIGINIFSGSLKGLTTDWPDLIHRITLTDVNDQTINRYFLIISLEQNLRTCLWTATFIEVYNRVIYKSYNDTFTFKYLAE